MDTNQRLKRNLAYKTTGEMVNRFLAFLYYVLLTRMLEIELFGIYSFAYSFTAVFMVFVDFGLNTVLVRDVAANKELKEKYTNNILSLKLILSLITLVLICVVSMLLGYSGNIILIIFLMGIVNAQTAIQDFFIALFSAVEKMQYEAIVRIVNKTLTVIVSYLVLKSGYKLLGVANALIIVYLLSILLGFVFVFKIVPKLKFVFDAVFFRQLLKVSVVVGLSMVINVVYLRFDVVLLSFFHRSNIEIAWYNAVIKLYEVGQAVPLLITGASLPILANLYQSARENLKFFLQKVIVISIIVSLFIVVGVFLFSDIIIKVIYGEKFLGAVPSLKITMSSCIFMFVNYLLLNFLIVVDRQKLSAIFMLVCFIFNIVFNLLLIPFNGYIGSSVARLCSEFLLFLCFLIYMRKYFKDNKLKS